MRLNANEFAAYIKAAKLSPITEAILANIRTADPSRRVKGGRSNVHGAYPSLKMGLTIQFESKNCELPAIISKEHDPNTLEYYDQPPPIPIKYVTKNGRNSGVTITPDFFALERHAAGWEEWKPEDDLVKLAEKMPDRYQKQADGTWRSPAGERYAAQFGLFFRVRSQAEHDFTFQRNIAILADFYRPDCPDVHEETLRVFERFFAGRSWGYLAELDQFDPALTRDQTHISLARGKLLCDLSGEVLIERDKFKVFRDEASRKAYTTLIRSCNSGCAVINDKLDIRFGSRFLWDDKPWEVINAGPRQATIRGDHGEIVSFDYFELAQLASAGKILSIAPSKQSVNQARADKIYKEASLTDIEAATAKFEAIKPYLEPESKFPEDSKVPHRTLRHWLKKWRDAIVLYGNGFVGLIGKIATRGARVPKTPEPVRDLANFHIQENYENTRKGSKKHSWERFKDECKLKGLIPVSYATFCRMILERNAWKQRGAREGRKAAYADKPSIYIVVPGTPRHGDFAWQWAHIDSTQLDIMLVDDKLRKPLDRPWATVMLDPYTRRVLAFYISFDPPSYRSTLMVIRDCVRRHFRLPNNLILDNGKEFKNIWLDAFLAASIIGKYHRPPAQARYGSVMERWFGVSDQMLLHNLRGNTQATKLVRQLTPEVAPERHAIWSLKDFYPLFEEFCFEICNKQPHIALGMSPDEANEHSIRVVGARAHTLIPYTRAFLLRTAPSTQKGSAVIKPSGVKINGLYYNHPALHVTKDARVNVRYEPFDLALAYAYVDGEWITLASPDNNLFAGRTERELETAYAEIRKLRQSIASDKYSPSSWDLTRFFAGVEATEQALMQQRRDLENAQNAILLKPQAEGRSATPPSSLPKPLSGRALLMTTLPDTNSTALDQYAN